MLDHLMITVSDYDRSREFYLRFLEPLGYGVVMEFGRAAGLGAGRKPDFWIREGEPATTPIHIAFASHDRATVDRCYERAIAAGGRDNGPPGLRPDYHENYYGAFVYDPDGHNVEVVCHKPQM